MFTIRPARDIAFINREGEVGDMLATLRNPQVEMGFALFGSRRMGNTSILFKVVDELNKDAKTAAIYFSVWDIVENTKGGNPCQRY